MAEGIVLPFVARETLLPVSERVARLEEAMAPILATVEGETDAVALQSTLACLLWETLVQANWCGFYRRIGERTLAVGPYQGTLGCLRIDFARGVCGAAARTRSIQRIADVRTFPGHIACDARSLSELVIPVVCRNDLIAVLDIDSPSLDAFSQREAELIADLVARVFDRPDVIV